MDARREDVLDAPYFHLVFTVPDILNPVIYNNQKLLYDTLYHAASATIRELTADSKHLGASAGYICILHTWGTEMNFHPHIHTKLFGGGLTPKNEWKDGTELFHDTEWIPYCKKTFNGAQSVIDYLGKYTHRIAISNHHIIRMDDENVTFSVKDYRNEGQWKELTLSSVEFTRRFLIHVPHGLLRDLFFSLTLCIPKMQCV